MHVSNLETGAELSFRGELLQFYAAARLYWPLIISIGLFFGWLLSFPMRGPLYYSLVEGRNTGATSLTVLALTGLITGFIIAGIAGYYHRRGLAWFSLSSLPCALLSWIITGVDESLWAFPFLTMGIFAGMAIIGWVYTFASSVPAGQRGHVFSLAAALSNLVLYLIILLLEQRMDYVILLRVCSILGLGMVVLVLVYRNTAQSVQGTTAPPGTLEKKNFRAFQLLPFIFAIYAVGGLMYGLVENLSSPPSGPIGYYSLVPYIFFLFLAGYLADRVGRRLNAILGAIAIGAGFMFLGIFTGSIQFFFVQTFLVGGYAFADVFIWVIGADLARDRKIPLVYTVLLSTNIMAILTGVLLAENIRKAASGSETLTVSMAGLFSLVSLLFIIRFRENYHLQIQVKNRARAFEDLVSAIKLTPRETSVARLLLDGADTRKILEELVIAPDTLKTHLRNIYRKAGVKNRLEFTMAVLNNVSGPDAGTEED